MRAQHRRSDDRGAVAVIVAITVTLLLIPVAALGADLGSVYVREETLQGIAEDAARAGAAELAVRQRDDGLASADMNAARSAAVGALCAGVGPGSGWEDACTGTLTWAHDDVAANGEVSFYTGKPAADVGFVADQDAEDAAETALVTGIRVVTPPSRVQFGLAAAFTADHTDLQTAATAGLFTVLPRGGVFPMFVRPGEHGPFCTRSAPRSIWQPTQPAGCTNVARGNLTAARTLSAENSRAMEWNAATGFDRQHLPLPVTGTATFQVQTPTSTSLVRELSPGLFGGGVAPPRLKGGTCPRGGYTATSGPWNGLESAYLTDFVDRRIGDRVQFRTLVNASTVAGSTPTGAQRGWLDPGILRCGRLAVVPVLSQVPDPLPETGLTTRTYPVAYWRLAWFDDRLWSSDDQPAATGSCLQRGFYWADPDYAWICRSDLRAYTGYVLDPRLLPATVGNTPGVNAIDRYVGSGLPAVVRLLRDVADPPPS